MQPEFLLCFILLYVVPPSWTTLNSFPSKYFSLFEYSSTFWIFLMLLRLVEVLLTSDSSSTCQVLNCLEFTVFSSVCQSACIVAPRIVLFQCGTTISLAYDMANIPLHINLILAFWLLHFFVRSFLICCPLSPPNTCWLFSWPLSSKKISVLYIISTRFTETNPMLLKLSCLFFFFLPSYISVSQTLFLCLFLHCLAFV